MNFLAQIPSQTVVDTTFGLPISELQLNLTTLLILAMFIGRVSSYLSQRGGIKNWMKAIWDGGITGNKGVSYTEIKVAELEKQIEELRTSIKENQPKDE